jgi:hypothetical protein
MVAVMKTAASLTIRHMAVINASLARNFQQLEIAGQL